MRTSPPRIGRTLTQGSLILATAAAALTASDLPGARADDREVPAPPAVASPAAREASARVEEFARSHPRPVAPQPEAAASEWAEFAAAEHEFLRTFPIASGVEQWGCRLIDSVIQRVSGGIDSVDRTAVTVVTDCGGRAQPSMNAILSARDGLTNDGPGARLTPSCTTVAGGMHCFDFEQTFAHVTYGYQWLLTTPISGRVRLGWVNAPAPLCEAGYLVRASPVERFEQGWGISGAWPQNARANWSNAFESADEVGNIVGIRSIACQFG